jgi:hypothetical protein
LGSDPAPSQTKILGASLVRSPGYPAGKRMRRNMLLAGCLAVPYFSTVSHIRHDFQKTVIRRGMCVVIFSTAFNSSVAHSKNNSEM